MSPPHVLLVSFPAQGHINPTLQLSKFLVLHGVRATLVTTPLAHAKITTNSSSSASSGVAFASISDGFATDDPLDILHPDYPFQLQLHGSLSLTHLIRSFAASGRPVDCIIYNFLLPWVSDVAFDLNIPSALLWIQSTSVLSIYYHFLRHSPLLHDRLYDETDLPGLPTLKSGDLPSFLFPDCPLPLTLKLLSEMFRSIETSRTRWVLVNSFDALEESVVCSLKDLHLHTVCVGPLVPMAFLTSRDSSDKAFGGDLLDGKDGSEGSGAGVDVLKWLDSKPEGSVVYVSFGTMGTPSATQVDEIACGLTEYWGSFFVWVLRPPENHLGFPEGLGEKGLVVPWCGQVEVLAHPAVGCFVTHSGWNSVLEAVTNGKPMVCVPQWSDQPTNSKLVSHSWETGVRASRRPDGLLEGKELGRSVRLVMDGGEPSSQMRANAAKWKNLARANAQEGGSSHRAIQRFIDDLISSSPADSPPHQMESPVQGIPTSVLSLRA